MYLIFDRYMEYSIKGSTRDTRQKGVSRQHHLTPTMALPTQKVLLTVSCNKVQLIDLIVTALQNERQRFKLCGHKLVVTGRDPVTIEIVTGNTAGGGRCDNHSSNDSHFRGT